MSQDHRRLEIPLIINTVLTPPLSVSKSESRNDPCCPADKVNVLLLQALQRSRKVLSPAQEVEQQDALHQEQRAQVPQTVLAKGARNGMEG